jgi:hypothetical protein
VRTEPSQFVLCLGGQFLRKFARRQITAKGCGLPIPHRRKVARTCCFGFQAERHQGARRERKRWSLRADRPQLRMMRLMTPRAGLPVMRLVNAVASQSA